MRKPDTTDFRTLRLTYLKINIKNGKKITTNLKLIINGLKQIFNANIHERIDIIALIKKSPKYKIVKI